MSGMEWPNGAEEVMDFTVPSRVAMSGTSAMRLLRLSVLFGCAAVASCGGGGGDAPTPVPPSPPPVLPAVTSVPTPVGYSDAQMAVFSRLNELRAQAGLGLLAQNAQLDIAAGAHAAWEVKNDQYEHIEATGTPLYSGQYPRDRDENSGYGLSNFNDEVLTAGYSPSAAVDALVQVVYHRQAVLALELLDIGIGWSDVPIPSYGTPLVIDMAVPGGFSERSNGQTARANMDGVVVWPADGASTVWCAMGGEYPNPVPDTDMYQLGTPISISVDHWRALRTISFSLTEHASGQTVDSILLDAYHDPNHLIYSNFVSTIPTVLLKHFTRYDVDFEGAIDGSPLSKHWTFTTGGIDYPPPN